MMSYFLRDGYIFTSIEDGDIEISYKAYPTDKDGLPQVPDDTKYIAAVTAYVAERIGFRMYMEDLMTERKYERLNTDWLFRVQQAANSIRIPSLDQAEALKNQLVKMTLFSNHHAYNFRYLNSPESNKTYPNNDR